MSADVARASLVLTVENDRESAAKKKIADEENKKRLKELAEIRRFERLRNILSPIAQKDTDIHDIIDENDINHKSRKSTQH